MVTEPEEPRTDFEHAHDPELDEGGPIKTFLEHLEDLRWVLIKSLVALGVAMLICLLGGNVVMGILKRPLDKAKVRYPTANQVWTITFLGKHLGTYQLTDEQQSSLAVSTNRYVALRVQPVQIGTNWIMALQPDPNTSPEEAEHLKINIINLGPVGAFSVAVQVALYGGCVLAAPFIFYFVAGFIFPALRMHEKKYVYRGLGFGLFLFLLGVSFCYFILMPVALAASVGYSNWFGFESNQWRAEEYISFICKFMLGMGIGFQMPVVILTLVKIGVLNYRILSKARRYMIVINLVLGAVLTTPEVITQVLMALPLQLLYEVSVWITWWWERQERKKLERLRERT